MLVSVIVTCYNREKYIHDCISSIINQTYSNLEIIIVDDASNDNSINILKEFNDNRIKIISLHENVGCGMAKKIGCDNATGEYLTIVDSDDYIECDYIEQCVNCALTNKTDLVLSRQKVLTLKNKIKELKNEILTSTSAFFINCLFMKKELYNKLEFSTLRYFEDYAIMPRLWYYAKDNVSYLNNYSGYIYRCNPNDGISQCIDYIKEKTYMILGCIENIKYFNKINEKCPDLIYNYDRIKKYIESFGSNIENRYNNEYQIIMEFLNNKNN